MRVLSASTELKMYTTLRGLMLTMLGSHETSVAQDEAILQWLTSLRMRDHHHCHRGAPVSNSDLHSELDDSLKGASAASCASRHTELGGVPSVEDCINMLNEVFTVAEAERIASIPLDSDAYWKHVSAVTYRLTRKRILVGIIRRLDQLIAYFESMVRITETSTPDTAHESCTMLWQSLIDEEGLYNSNNYLSTAAAHQEDGHRRPSWDYVKRFKTYVWDATNPLQWPEL